MPDRKIGDARAHVVFHQALEEGQPWFSRSADAKQARILHIQVSNELELDEVQRAAQEQFAQQSKRYGAGHILADVSDVVAALQRIALPLRADILDVATGAGHTGLHFASIGHRVICADLAAPMLERVRESAAARKLQIETRQHTAERLPYPENAFDLVSCRVAAHHFTSPEAFVAETARVLRPGGWFLLIDGSVPDDEPEAEAWIHQLEKLRDPSHHRFLTAGAWGALCARHNLQVERSELVPMKQPDLEWYFETASTPAANRSEVRQLIAHAPPAAMRVFRLAIEEGKQIWWWPRLTLVARKGTH